MLVHRRLLGHQEARPDPGGLRAEREHSRDTPPVADPAGCDHRRRLDRIDDGGHERERSDLTPHMAARVQALRDDDVDARGDHALRLLGRADRVQQQRARIVNPIDVRRRIAPEERDDA